MSKCPDQEVGQQHLLSAYHPVSKDWGGLMSVVRLLLYSGWTYRLGNSGWWWWGSTPRMPATRTHSAMLPLSLCVTLISIHTTSLLPQHSSNWKKIPAQPSGWVSRAGSFQGKQGALRGLFSPISHGSVVDSARRNAQLNTFKGNEV